MGVIAEKTVYQAKYFRITQKTIERNGKTFTKDFIQRSDAVSILPITENGEIYLESQYRDAFGKRMLEIVAGTIEGTDDPLETAKRELKEEAGLTATTWKKLATWELSVNLNSTQHIFLATGLTEGERQLDGEEDIEIVKMPIDEAIAKVMSGEICASIHVAALLLYDALRKEGNV